MRSIFLILFILIAYLQPITADQSAEFVIDINSLHYQDDPKPITEYLAVAKIYPQLQIQIKKVKELQANKVQNLPKDNLNNDKKQIKWRLNNNFQLFNFVIDENGLQVTLQSSETLIVQQPKQPDLNVLKEEKNKKQIETVKNFETTQTKQVPSTVTIKKQDNKYQLIYILMASLVIAILLFCSYMLCCKQECCKKEKARKKFQYKSAPYNSEIQIKQDQSQAMFKQGQYSIILYSQDDY